MKNTSSYWWEWTKDKKKKTITIVGENEQTKENKREWQRALVATIENEQRTKKNEKNEKH
jgi:hypothetical protein